MTADLRDPKIQEFRRRILDDTGYCCRNLLGWNFDRDDQTGELRNVGTGGIYASGPHADMVRFLDNQKKRFKLLMAPRASRKSTLLQGFVTRHILRNPNVRILYGMLNDHKVEDKSTAIRAGLAQDRTTVLFGNQVGEPWETTRFTVATRTRKNLQEPTFSTFTTASPATGGHYEIVIVDDPIDTEWLGEDMMARAKRSMRQVFPLLEHGGIFVLCGTRYGEDDVFAEAEQNPQMDKLILDSGDDVEVVQDGSGRYQVVGTPRFPFVTLEHLNNALGMMKPRAFMSQYMNRIASDVRDQFRREQFQATTWDSDMRQLSGYLLTDTAISQQESGCYSVIAYVGLDQAHNVYLLDLRVGKWLLDEFAKQFFDVRDAWSARVNHIGETMEVNQASMTVGGHLYHVAHQRKQRLNIIRIKRTGAAAKKDIRIKALQPVFAERRFFVVDTAPKTFQDLDSEKLLWDPEGHDDPRSGTRLPSGELVTQFVQLGSCPRNDIADAIADIEAVNRENHQARYCVWKPAKKQDQLYDVPQLRHDRQVAYNRTFPSGGAEQDYFQKLAQDWGLAT